MKIFKVVQYYINGFCIGMLAEYLYKVDSTSKIVWLLLILFLITFGLDIFLKALK